MAVRLTVRQMKKALRAWGKKKGQRVRVVLNPVKGEGFRAALGKFKAMEMGLNSSRIDAETKAALAKWLPPKIKVRYRILSQFRAIHHSGLRPASAIKRICLHSTEYDDPRTPDRGAETLGQMTETAGYQASPQFCIDDDSIQCTLPDWYVAWQVQGDNYNSIGIEIFGYARWTRAQWLKHDRMLDMVAYVVAKKAKRYSIPIKVLTVADIRADRKGIETHGLVTRTKNIAGGHTDPGSGFPMDRVLERAREYQQSM